MWIFEANIGKLFYDISFDIFFNEEKSSPWIIIAKDPGGGIHTIYEGESLEDAKRKLSRLYTKLVRNGAIMGN